MNMNNLINDFNSNFVPYGICDVETALELCQEVFPNEYAPNFLYELLDSQADDMGMKVQDLDVVGEVYEHILQLSRNEIDSVTGYDILNDCENGEIYVSANFMCTSFDYPSGAIEELKSKLIDFDLETFSHKTKWFLNDIGVM